MRPLLLGLMVLSTACSKKVDPKPDPAPQPDPGSAIVPVKPAGPPTCEAGLQRLYDAIQRTGLPEEQAANTPDTLAEQVAQCKRQPWPLALVACMNEIDSVELYMSRCYKAAFAGEIDLKLVREIDAAADTSAMQPPVFFIDGDFLVFDQTSRCGLVSKKLPPAEGVLVVCGGKVLAGPFTTPDEVQRVAIGVRLLAADPAKLKRELPLKYPTSCPTCRYTVHDAQGKLVPE
ncbi:MAG: hypothetical protein H6Q90_1591 [Deltaproteobacteria bacterium]|nr:hypothetical protein [Deltaproteobacteria bacterium]